MSNHISTDKCHSKHYNLGTNRKKIKNFDQLLLKIVLLEIMNALTSYSPVISRI